MIKIPRLQKAEVTNGPLSVNILRYALPVFLSAMANNLMTAADTAVIGNMADSVAIASVAATGTVTSLLIGSMFGFAQGMRIILARALGKGDNERARLIVNTGLILAALLGVVIMALGIAFSRPILELINCPDDCMSGAMTYLCILFAATPLSLVYNFGSCMISTSGDSVKPMKFMLISGACNVVLNVIFCWVMSDKVAAVAIATVIGYGISCVLVLRELYRHETYRVRIRALGFSFKECGLIFRFGLPMAINTAMAAIINTVMVSAINSWGSSVVAGNSAADNVALICGAVNAAAVSTVPTFVGQNLGANNLERAKKSLILCILLDVAILLPVMLVMNLFSEPLLQIFVPNDSMAVAYGAMKMKAYIFFFLYSVACCISGALQSLGYPAISTVNSIVTLLCLRALWMLFVYPLNPTLPMLALSVAVCWPLHLLIESLIFAVIYFKRFKKGKIKEI